MIGRILKSGLRRFGYDITVYPMPEWYLLRTGLSELLTSQRINCVIDVGANYGQYGDFLRQIGYKGNIVSFEPVSASFRRLADHVKNDRAWCVYNLAVGAVDDTLEMNVMDGDQFSSLLSLNSYGRELFPSETVVTRKEKVNVVRLDSIISEITAGIEDPRIYLKMDTQGCDLQVLEGAAGFLPLVLGLQSEIALRPIYTGMPSYLNSLEKLNELGFSLTSLIPVSRDKGLRVIEYDCLMVANSQS